MTTPNPQDPAGDNAMGQRLPYVLKKRMKVEGRRMKTEVVCAVLMDVTKSRDAREAVLSVYLLCE